VRFLFVLCKQKHVVIVNSCCGGYDKSPYFAFFPSTIPVR
jgi:hypothetical protein